MICVVNKSSLVSDDEAKLMTRAVAHQIRYDVAPNWNRLPLPVVYLDHESAAPAGAWVLAVLDDPDQADALGWHTEGADGTIFGKVFARPVFDNGGDALYENLSVGGVLSHEAVEIFGDQSVNLWADTGAGQAVALELCDPVESTSYAVRVRGHNPIRVSDFVYPAWFDAQAPRDSFYDHCGVVNSPFEIAKDGYAVVLQEGKVSQVFGERFPEWRWALKEGGRSATFRHPSDRRPA